MCAHLHQSQTHLFTWCVTFLQKIKKGDLERFQKWLNGKKGRVNCYRGGLATEGGLVVEGGTALHWAAYYGQRDIVDALIRGKAGLIIVKNNSWCNENIPDQHSTYFYPHVCALHLICGWRIYSTHLRKMLFSTLFECVDGFFQGYRRPCILHSAKFPQIMSFEDFVEILSWVCCMCACCTCNILWSRHTSLVYLTRTVTLSSARARNCQQSNAYLFGENLL